MQARRPVMLVVLDGWGWREDRADNAVLQARTPTFDRLWNAGPHAFLRTSGRDVGLPDGQMGNSEVGHLNIGAGRVVMQDLPRIADAIASGAIARAKSATFRLGSLGTKISPPHIRASEMRTQRTACSSVIQKRVMRMSVSGRRPVCARHRKWLTTLPRLPITLP